MLLGQYVHISPSHFQSAFNKCIPLTRTCTHTMMFRITSMLILNILIQYFQGELVMRLKECMGEDARVSQIYRKLT